MATDTVPIAERGVATLSEQAWERARCRAEIIGPLAQSETVGHEAADAAAQALGLSRRQVYVLIRRARQGSGLVTDLALGQSSGGKGKGRLPESVERIIRELLQSLSQFDGGEPQAFGSPLVSVAVLARAWKR
ncbi:putative transposase [Halopseudomonas bauzanensis]|uniref:Helix-turn-helix domain-containing protein n=1 Tax=Halopseudomonas bauzanensis TaxID=653930 RepID=A0A1H9NG78_9GAMM|nr:putative transposase [Halopseudomonas bauzanensis]SFL81312.1 Helix-turn-helix domain-containing protein [Halopseudomonas bauzanensis]